MYRQILAELEYVRSEHTLCSNVYIEVQCSQISQEETTSGVYGNSAVYCILEMVPTNCSSSSLNFYIHIIIVHTDSMYLFDLVGVQKRKKNVSVCFTEVLCLFRNRCLTLYF